MSPKCSNSYARSESKIKLPVGPLVLNNEIVWSKAIANIPMNQYDSAFSRPIYADTENNKSVLCHFEGPNNFTEFDLKEKNIVDSINKISSEAAAGRGGFPSVLLNKFKFGLKVAIKKMAKFV